MGFLALATLVVAAVGAATSALLWVSRGAWRPTLAAMAPAPRARWLQLALAAPTLAGLAMFTLALGPCLHTLALGLPDDCASHGGPGFSLCLACPAHVGALVWAVCLAALARPGLHGARAARAVWAARSLLNDLRSTAGRADDGAAWMVPGTRAFTAGWPRAAVFIGRDLALRLSDGALAAVRAHEAAHMRRGDIHRKLAARLAAATHLPALGRLLVADLDLAIEQTCDAEAARVVGDPLVVAQALIDAARLEMVAPTGCMAAFAEGALDTRIAALCAPAWRPSRRPLAALLLALALLGALALGFDHPVHDAVEAAVAALAG